MSNEKTEQSFNSDKVRDILIKILDISLYEELLEFFGEVLASDSKYVVFIAKKSYALFRAFESLLGKDHEKIILHDKLLALYVDAIRGDDAKVLIVDDTLIHGRSVCCLMQSLINDFKIKSNRIRYSVFIANKKRLDIKNNVLKIFDDGTELVHFINDTKIALLSNPIVCDLSIVRKHSALFLKAIHAVLIPYVDYIPAFQVPWNSENKAIIYKIKQSGIEGKTYQSYDMTTPLLKELGIIAFCIEIPLNSSELYSYVRIYVSEQIEKIIVIPHIIFPTIKNIDEYYQHVKSLFGLLEISSNLCKEQSDLIKNRVLHNITSYILGGYFSECSKLYINPISVQVVSDDVIKKTMEFGHKKMRYLFSKIAPKTNDAIVESKKNNQLNGDFFQSALNTSVDSDVFDFLSQFLLFDINKDIPPQKRSEGILISSLVDSIKEVKRFSNVTKQEVYRAISKLCDLGRAVIQVFEMEGAIGCFVQNGEQAIQCITDFYKGSFAFFVGLMYRRFRNNWDNVKVHLYYFLKHFIDTQKINIPLGLIEVAVNYSEDSEKILSLKPDEFMVRDLITSSQLEDSDEDERTGIMLFQALIIYFPDYMHTVIDSGGDLKKDVMDFKTFLLQENKKREEFECWDVLLESI